MQRSKMASLSKNTSKPVYFIVWCLNDLARLAKALTSIFLFCHAAIEHIPVIEAESFTEAGVIRSVDVTDTLAK